MPLYYYRAINKNSKSHKGFIDAHSEEEAREKLRAFGVMVTEIRSKAYFGLNHKVSKEAVLLFTIQLSQLLHAGLPLYESLLTLEEQHRGEKLQHILLRICDKIKAGSSLSEAFNLFPESFNMLYRSMIAAGEQAGALEAVLDKLAVLYSRQLKIRKQLMGALLYPMILGAFCLLLIILLVTFIVPSLEMFFEGRQLKPFTQVVLVISYFLRQFWWIYMPILVALIGFLAIKLRTRKGKAFIESQLIRLPILGRLIIEISISRFVHTLGTLLDGGVNLVEGLELSKGTILSTALEEVVSRAREKIMQGSSLSVELAKSVLLPPIVIRMLSIGEESGSMSHTLEKLSDIYESKVEKTLTRLTTLASPIMLLIMGIVIGSIMLAVLLPLTDVSSFTD